MRRGAQRSGRGLGLHRVFSGGGQVLGAPAARAQPVYYGQLLGPETCFRFLSHLPGAAGLRAGSVTAVGATQCIRCALCRRDARSFLLSVVV